MVPPVIDILGFFMSSGYSAAFIFLTEIVDSEKRAKLGLSVNVLFGAGSVFYSLGGYMFRNWRHLITWVISLTNRRAEEAFQIAEKIAKKNGREITLEEFESCDSRVESRKGTQAVSLMTLFKSRMIASITLVQCWMWAAIAMGYYGKGSNTGQTLGQMILKNDKKR